MTKTASIRKSRGSQRMASISQSMPVLADLEPSKPMEKVFTVSIASSHVDKEAAFSLAYRHYLEKGYVQENALGLLVNDYDTHASTQVLIVKNQARKVIATVTLVFGALTKIPSSETFDYSDNDIDIDVAQTVELSRIVVEDGYTKDEIILQKLLAWSYLCAQQVSPEGCMVGEVNPKHVFYYTQTFGFEILGDEVPCLMVGNAPAILMSLPFQTIQDAIAGTNTAIADAFINVYHQEKACWQFHVSTNGPIK